MQVKTQRELIESLLLKWEKAFYNRRMCQWTVTDRIVEHQDYYQNVHERLSLLDFSKTSAEEIESIIGNKVYTNYQCSVCDELKPSVIELTVGYNEDQEICLDCIETMHNLVVKEKNK